jgi:type II secretory pathway component PulJ
LLTLPFLLTTAALFIAAVALVRARRASRRLERLTESYWELRYEVAQMRARVARLEPPAAADPAEAAAANSGTTTAFVPLSSLKRS